MSIALPVFNGENYLADALESLLSQSYADFELIICDNGSDDRTREISELYMRRDDRVRYLAGETNRGAAWNYNRGLEAASGRYFKWASHDDLCAPTYLERCVEVLDRAPESVVLAYPKTVLIDEAGRFLRGYEDGLDLRDEQPHRRLRSLIRNLVMSNAVFGLIRKDALEKTRRHGSYISADYILLAELALLGQFWEIPEPLFLRRDHSLMSRRANRTRAELSEWFETGA
ncbi:MAG TPA: glycosyltransferase family 2 protein, partial [Gaiellaceae bacterium]|nr:glycosyltransferase family 2 protein [Gaiellaceae bacterium]